MENTPSASNNEIDSLTLDNIFKRIISTNSEIELTLDILNHVIEYDLNINFNGLDDDQKLALPYMLMRYIKNWPGWSRKEEYDNGSIALEDWMLRFRNFIYYKMQSLVTKTLPDMVNSQKKSKLNTVHVKDISTQSVSLGNFINFSIDLSGPASLLNNLVFSGYKGHIRVEEHADRPWINLNCNELLNYPFIEVEFNSSELSFKRSFEPKISQYLSSYTDFKEEESNFILGKNSINDTSLKWPIKISILENYIKAFKSEIISQIPSTQQEEINCVLDEFYQDMVDISENDSIFENYRVTFNIGRNVYKRTKKISTGGSSLDVIFNEMVLPKVTLSFRHFTGMQNDSANKIAADPDKIDTKMMLAFIPVITYKCLFCKLNFPGHLGRADLVTHLQHKHGRSQTLVCLHCKKCIEVAELSSRRWKCTCF
ncbi:uncharacterized protein LOC123682306 isoform X1 [Harmonia axyridis]|uniref:uncharacterized protein LOC123682306 isoform X1 n=1 Tax=Harmonia axyridis TaxID=115357 RepID=UPI001E276470|nr:uncharacterized protein LOC123682306 isoform X1 [Harmonia axyridis]